MDEITRRKLMDLIAQQRELPGKVSNETSDDAVTSPIPNLEGLPQDIQDPILEDIRKEVLTNAGAYYPAYGLDREGSDRAYRMADDIKEEKFKNIKDLLKKNK